MEEATSERDWSIEMDFSTPRTVVPGSSWREVSGLDSAAYSSERDKGRVIFRTMR